MKELTIEQKAQRYDEAIKKLKILHDDWATTQNRAAKEVEEVFPELNESKESKDERIRKGIKSILEHYKESGEVVCPYPFVSINEALAWLEKQGEQKTVDEIAKDVCKNRASATTFLKSAGIMNEKGELAEQYRQDEQKSYASKTMNEKGDFDNGFTRIMEKEQTPNWSEKDKKMSRFIGNAITADDASMYLKSKGIQVIDAHVWLEEIKDRVQHKQEWSEEDKRCLTNAISACTQMSDEDYDYSQCYIDAINWLKSLKERYAWKPTMEQLTVLSKAIELRPLYESDGTILMSLYYDLKKLTE